MKNIRVFILKIFSFVEVKCSIYLNRHVFIMTKTLWVLIGTSNEGHNTCFHGEIRKKQYQQF